MRELPWSRAPCGAVAWSETHSGARFGPKTTVAASVTAGLTEAESLADGIWSTRRLSDFDRDIGPSHSADGFSGPRLAPKMRRKHLIPKGLSHPSGHEPAESCEMGGRRVPERAFGVMKTS